MILMQSVNMIHLFDAFIEGNAILTDDAMNGTRKDGRLMVIRVAILLGIFSIFS